MTPQTMLTRFATITTFQQSGERMRIILVCFAFALPAVAQDYDKLAAKIAEKVKADCDRIKAKIAKNEKELKQAKSAKIVANSEANYPDDANKPATFGSTQQRDGHIKRLTKNVEDGKAELAKAEKLQSVGAMPLKMAIGEIGRLPLVAIDQVASPSMALATVSFVDVNRTASGDVASLVKKKVLLEISTAGMADDSKYEAKQPFFVDRTAKHAGTTYFVLKPFDETEAKKRIKP